MGFFKNLSRRIFPAPPRRRSNPIPPTEQPTPAPPRKRPNPAHAVSDALRDVGEDVAEGARTVADGARTAGVKARNMAEDVGQDVRRAGESVGEFIGDVEHFAKTGDLGRAVQKLQVEKSEAEAALSAAHAEHRLAVQAYVDLFLKRKTLSIVYETADQAATRTPSEAETADVDVNLYGNFSSKGLDMIGLDQIAAKIRVVNSFVPALSPADIIFKQVELAEARKLLRADIKALRTATTETKAETVQLMKAADKLEEEVDALEARIVSLNLDPETHGATAVMAQQVSDRTTRETASELLGAGLDIATVAEVTGLSADAVQALADKDPPPEGR